MLGQSNGVASLGASGKIPVAQIPGLPEGATGAAPAGYGLGASAKHLASWDDVSANGFFYANSDGPTSGWWFGICKVAANDASRFVTVWKIGENGIWYKCERQYYAGVGWGSWEFANPPMTLGTEYRTTRRYLGKAVYVKLVNFGAMPNNASLTVSNLYTATNLLRTDGFTVAASGQSGPFGTGSSRAAIDMVANTTGVVTITTTSDLSSYTAYIYMEYTKD